MTHINQNTADLLAQTIANAKIDLDLELPRICAAHNITGPMFLDWVAPTRKGGKPLASDEKRARRIDLGSRWVVFYEGEEFEKLAKSLNTKVTGRKEFKAYDGGMKAIKDAATEYLTDNIDADPETAVEPILETLNSLDKLTVAHAKAVACATAFGTALEKLAKVADGPDAIDAVNAMVTNMMRINAALEDTAPE